MSRIFRTVVLLITLAVASLLVLGCQARSSSADQSSLARADADAWHTQAQLLAQVVQDADVADPSSAPEPPAGSVMQEGRYLVIVGHMSVASRTITVDRVQLLSGDSARAAAKADGAPEPPDDVYVRNRVAESIVMSVEDSAAVVVWDPSRWLKEDAYRNDYPPNGLSMTALTFAHFSKVAATHVDQLAPVWITVTDGKVVSILETYRP